MMSVWVNWNSFSFQQSSFCQFTIRLEIVIVYFIPLRLFLFRPVIRICRRRAKKNWFPVCNLMVRWNFVNFLFILRMKWSCHTGDISTVSHFCRYVWIGMFTFFTTKWIWIHVVSIFGVTFHTSNAIKIQRMNMSMLNLRWTNRRQLFCCSSRISCTSQEKFIKVNLKLKKWEKIEVLVKFVEMQWSARANKRSTIQINKQTLYTCNDYQIQ